GVVGLAIAGAHDLSSGSRLRLGESDLLDALLGAALGAGLLLSVRAAYKAFRGVEGMGSGDVTMIAMIGALSGPAGVLLSLFFGSLSGALLGAGLVASRELRWARARRGLARGDAAAAVAAG